LEGLVLLNRDRSSTTAGVWFGISAFCPFVLDSPLADTGRTGEGGPAGRDAFLPPIASYFWTISDIDSRRGVLGCGSSGGIRFTRADDDGVELSLDLEGKRNID